MAEKSKRDGVLGAALLGAVVGATAVALLNKNMRGNIKKTLVDTLDEGEKKLDDVTEGVNKLKKKVITKAEKGIGQAKARIEQTS